MTFQNVDVTQTPSGETTNIVLKYNFPGDTYYSNNRTASGIYDPSVDGIFEATRTTDPSGAIITGLIPGSTWVVHVEKTTDGSGGTQEIKVEGVPAKPVNGVNCTVTGYLNKINFDFSTNRTIWNHGTPKEAKVIIKSLDASANFQVHTKTLSDISRSFDISGFPQLPQLTNFELTVQLTSTVGSGPKSDSFVVRTDNQRAAVTITRAIGVNSLEKTSPYVDICFNVGSGPNAAAANDIIRFALDGCANLIDTSGLVGTLDASGNYGMRLISDDDLTGGDHTIKLLIQAKGTSTADLLLITNGNASNSANFNIKFKPLAPSFTVKPKNATNNAITFTFDGSSNNGWLPSYKAVVTASGEIPTPFNETDVSPGPVTLSEDVLTKLSGVSLNSNLVIHIKKTVNGSGVVNDNSASSLDLSNTNAELFYIVDPIISSITMTEIDDPSQNYLHITYVLGAGAVHAKSALTAYIRYDDAWDLNDPKTASNEEFNKPLILGPNLVGIDVAIDSSANDGSNVYVLLELDNEDKLAYKTAELILKDREPEPKLTELFGWSDYGTDANKAAFDFEFNKPTDGILADQRFEVWLKDLSSGVFKNVASDIKATKLRAGGVTIRASIKKSDIVDASGFSPNDVNYNDKTDLSFGVAQTNPNYTLTSSDFTTGFTNHNGNASQTVTQNVAPVRYHPVNVQITSVEVAKLDSKTVTVKASGSNLTSNGYTITIFDSSNNKSLGIAVGSTGKFKFNDDVINVTTTSAIPTGSEYRLVLQVTDGNKVLSQDTQVFTYTLAPVIDTSTNNLNLVKTAKTVNTSLTDTTTIDVSGRYSVNINPNGAALTSVQAMYYADSAEDTAFAKVDVPVVIPSDISNGNYTAYIKFTNMEGAIVLAANPGGMDAHHFFAPQ